ncbi:MAG: AI-2E family transporter, partial [Verrucomicrobiota bacterium]
RGAKDDVETEVPSIGDPEPVPAPVTEEPMVVAEGGELDPAVAEKEKKLQDIIDLEENLEQGEKTILELLDVGATEIVGFINKTEVVQTLISVLSTSFFIFVVMIFILTEGAGFAKRVRYVAKADGPHLGKVARASLDIQRYLGIKTLVSILTGILAWITTSFFGLDFALLWGVLAFTLNYIPAIGSVIAAIPPCILAMAQLGMWPSFFILCAYLAINIGLGNFLEPMLLGKRFGLSTVVIILSVLFWGWVWGPPGMFLAVPLTMVLKVMLDTTEEFRWISVAMSKSPQKHYAMAKQSEANRLTKRRASGKSPPRDEEDLPMEAGKSLGET